MTKIYYTLLAGITVLVDTTTTRVHDLKNSDRGSVSVEQVIITGGLLVLSVAVLGGIGALVNNKLGLIK